MSTWTLYHNPRCSKSRQALALLEEKNIHITVIEYLKTPPSEEELLDLMNKLDDIKKLVRIKEEAYQENPFSLEEPQTIARELARNPKLIERPVIIKEGLAVIARPFEKIYTLF